MLLFAFSGNAEVINIPDDFEMIQEGINVAEDGDSVLVTAGEYRENVVIEDKSIFLIGSPDNPAEVIIDGNSNGRSVIAFRRGGEGLLLLSGFSIVNGRTDFGGGIYCHESNPIITSTIITSNTSDRSGAGCYLTANSFCRISNVIFSDNTAGLNGGALCIFDQSSAEIDDVEFINNSAENAGGGIFNTGNITIDNGRFSQNIAINSGGGIYLWDDANLNFQNGIFEGNSARFGGAVSVMYDCFSFMDRVVFSGNSGSIGNALYISSEWDEPYRVDFIGTNLTVCRNAGESVVFYAGRDNQGEVEITNSILWENEGIIRAGGTGTIRYSLMQVREDNEFSEDFQIGEGVFPDDPMFQNLDESNYNLRTRSPCIDAGDPESDPDPDGTRADMGAFYFHQRDIEVEVEELDFEPIPAGSIDSLSFVIRNTGGNDLTINSFSWSNNAACFHTLEEDSFEIRQNDEYVVWVFFEPDAPVEFRSTLIIDSDDPDEGEIGIAVRGRSFLGVDDERTLPDEFDITGIYPNPFNSTTTITYSLAVTSPVSLQVFDIKGRLAEILLDGVTLAGIHNVVWEAGDNPAGVYLLGMKDEGGWMRGMQKVVLVK